MVMADNNDNVFVTTQVASFFQWNEDQSKQRRFSANMLNQNGFICFIQGRGNKGNFSNLTNFYCRFDDLPIFAAVIDYVLEDIEKGDFTKERKMKGNKSNISFPVKENNGKLYVGIKITKNNKNGQETNNSEVILLDTRMEDEVHKGTEQLRALSESLKATYYRTSSSYDRHFQKYFEALEDEDGNSSGGSRSSKKPKPENDSDFPFGN
jgi:hypothetical protein